MFQVGQRSGYCLEYGYTALDTWLCRLALNTGLATQGRLQLSQPDTITISRQCGPGKNKHYLKVILHISAAPTAPQLSKLFGIVQ